MIKRLISFITIFFLLLLLTACNNAVNDPKVDGVVVLQVTDAGKTESFRTLSANDDTDAVGEIRKSIQDFDFDDHNGDDFTPMYHFYLTYDEDAGAIPKAVVYSLGKTTDGEHVVIGEEDNFDNVDILDEEDSKEIYQLLIGEKLN